MVKQDKPCLEAGPAGVFRRDRCVCQGSRAEELPDAHLRFRPRFPFLSACAEAGEEGRRLTLGSLPPSDLSFETQWPLPRSGKNSQDSAGAPCWDRPFLPPAKGPSCKGFNCTTNANQSWNVPSGNLPGLIILLNRTAGSLSYLLVHQPDGRSSRSQGTLPREGQCTPTSQRSGGQLILSNGVPSARDQREVCLPVVPPLRLRSHKGPKARGSCSKKELGAGERLCRGVKGLPAGTHHGVAQLAAPGSQAHSHTPS